MRVKLDVKKFYFIKRKVILTIEIDSFYAIMKKIKKGRIAYEENIDGVAYLIAASICRRRSDRINQLIAKQ
jgi:hypothetical protein